MAFQERIEPLPEIHISVTEDLRTGYEQVDGEWYPFCGPAGDPDKPVPCEEVDGEWYPFAEEGAPVVQGIRHHQTVRPLENMVRGLLLDWGKGVGIYSDVFLFWKKPQKDPQGPDLVVFPRVRKHRKPRESVYLWEEPSSPVFVVEILSDRNNEADQEKTFRIYQDELKIPEYFVIEPRTTPKQVWGYRLEEGEYVPVEPDEQGRIWSEQLKGWFGINDAGQVQVWNEANEPMPDHEDALRQLRAERKRVQAERQRVQAERKRAEAERKRAERAERLAAAAARRAEKEARRADEEARRADEEALRASEASHRAEDEARRREAAEARVRELEMELRRVRSASESDGN